MNYIDFMKSGGIHIKKKNRGKFTDYCGGKVTTECIQRGRNSPSATIRKRTTFAQNARSWSKHEEGGILHAQTGAKVNLSYQTLTKKTEDPEEIKLQNPEEESKETTVSEAPQLEETNWWDAKAQQYLQMSSVGQQGSAAGSSQTQSSQSEGEVSTEKAASYKEVMDYLQSKGFNKEAAAGITGVFMAESGLKPGILNQDESKKYGHSAGKGLGQWSNSRRSQYDEFTKGRTSGIQTDLDFFIYDLESRPLVKQALASATSVEDAVRAMHLGYENGSSGAMSTPEAMQRTYSAAWSRLGYRPYSYQKSHNTRLKYANQAYTSV